MFPLTFRHLEIALRIIKNIEDALIWLKFTFLYAKMCIQPNVYGLPSFDSPCEIDIHIKGKSYA